MVNHPVKLRGFSEDQVRSAPLILSREDADFIPALLEELKSPAGRLRMLQQAATKRDSSGHLRLFQPVHRHFNVLVLETYCDTPGLPRLDPSKIESAGLVLRRKNAGATGWDAWMRVPDAVPTADKPRLRGWVVLADQKQTQTDPDPKRRPLLLSAGHPAINRLLAAQVVQEHLAEEVTPLFVAPPEVCAAAKRTILYGLVPVTSSDQSEMPPPAPDYLDDRIAPGETMSSKVKLRSHLSGYLLAQGSVAGLPRVQTAVAASWADEADTFRTVVSEGVATAEQLNLVNFVLLLRQLSFEFDAFGDNVQGKALLNELNKIELVLQEEVKWDASVAPTKTVPAGDFLRDAARVVIQRDDTGTPPIVPLRWPAIDGAQADRLLTRIAACLTARAPLVNAREGRFDNSNAAYAVRAFIRVKRDDGCPPAIVWSAPSEPFSIAPWFESSGAPPVQIALPEANLDFLKKLKPNIAFVVPESLMKMLSGNGAKDLADGKGKAGGGGIGLGWICSFSIPIITLCAFIVLNIFLQLFDIIFRWMMFIKICIPFPTKK